MWIDSTTLLCPRRHARCSPQGQRPHSRPSQISRSPSEGGPTAASSPAATRPPATTPGDAGPGAGSRELSSTTTTPDGPCRPGSCRSGPSERASVGFRLARHHRERPEQYATRPPPLPGGRTCAADSAWRRACSGWRSGSRSWRKAWSTGPGTTSPPRSRCWP